MKREKVITASPLPPPIEGEKERAMHNCSAVFFAVDFSQRIKKYDVRTGLQPHSMWLKPVAENIEYRISNVESGSCADTNVPYSLFLISYFLFLNISTVCLPAPLDPLKGAPRLCKKLGAEVVCRISPLELVPIYREVRGSAGIGMSVKRILTNNEYRMSNVESGSCADTNVPYFLFLIPYFLFQRFIIAVDFSQRNQKQDINGLQPNSMWLKPVFDCNYSARQLNQTAIQIHNQIHNYCEGKELIMKEMNYNDSNTGLNSNPEGLHVYRKRQHCGNTTPAGVAQPMFIVHFYKHSMPPASILPLTSVNGKETASRSTGLQPNNMWLKPVSAFNISNRQLKQTAINSAAHSAPKNEISTVFYNNTPALGGTTGADELGLVGSVFNN